MYALYYEGNLLGIITDAGRFGSIEGICDTLSPDGLAECSWVSLDSDIVEKMKAITANVPSNKPWSQDVEDEEDEDEWEDDDDDDDEDEWEEVWEDDDEDDDDDDDEWCDDEDEETSDDE